jgi:hypothetical protein
MKNLLLLMVVGFCVLYYDAELHAQVRRKPVVSLKKVEIPKYEISLHFTRAITQLHSSSFSNEETSKPGSISGVDFSYSVYRYARIHMGVSMGFDYSTYKTEFNTAYQDSVETTDFTNDNVIVHEKAFIHEIQKVSFLNIPVLFKFNYILSSKISAFVNLGPELSLPLKKTYQSSGPYTRTGYYPQYNAPISNVNDSLVYYPSNLPIASQGVLKIGTGLTLRTGIGVKYRLNYRLSVYGNFDFAYGIININKTSGSQQFLISPSYNSLNSLMGRGDKISNIAYGLQFGFAVNVTKKPVPKDKSGGKTTDKADKK